MRVGQPYGKVRLTAKCGDKVLAQAVKLKVAPGEMEKLVIKTDKFADLTGEITVTLEEM